MTELARQIQDRLDSRNKETREEAYRMWMTAPTVVTYMDDEYVDRLEAIYQERN